MANKACISITTVAAGTLSWNRQVRPLKSLLCNQILLVFNRVTWQHKWPDQIVRMGFMVKYSTVSWEPSLSKQGEELLIKWIKDESWKWERKGELFHSRKELCWYHTFGWHACFYWHFHQNKSSTWISYIPFQQRQILIKNNTSFQVSKGNPLIAVSG